ncbi:response regulator [Muricauda sp. TY007]|uniref:response regulator transcription factor n=1 Tax=Allomuricauda sp. TY007 TaxID=2683200 RepID=UPI0013BFE231|nr:response regulator transcription factor [Muricauda sp. TY007]NDV16336.1 response regulator [Muricauda sp. TY007]
MKILLIEDEPQMVNTIKDSLEKEGYLVEFAMDFHSAIERVFVYEYDCILLDIMLPNGSGLDILKKLKKENKSENVIIISARDSLDDKLEGLELGADDYLTKPFYLAELNARVKAVLRRKELNGKNSIEMANVVLEMNNHELLVNGNNIPLNRKEFGVLNYFLLNKNRLVSKEALAEYVWGDHSDNSDNFDFVYYQIKNLRKKLNDSGAGIRLESIYGVGYKLIEV